MLNDNYLYVLMPEHSRPTRVSNFVFVECHCLLKFEHTRFYTVNITAARPLFKNGSSDCHETNALVLRIFPAVLINILSDLNKFNPTTSPPPTRSHLSLTGLRRHVGILQTITVLLRIITYILSINLPLSADQVHAEDSKSNILGACSGLRVRLWVGKAEPPKSPNLTLMVPRLSSLPGCNDLWLVRPLSLTFRLTVGCFRDK